MSGPERDLHSGNDGGVFHEPMADLVQLLGSLHGPGGKVSVPGFHNSVRPQLMELAWQGLEHSEEFSMRSYRLVVCVRVDGVSCVCVWGGGGVRGGGGGCVWESGCGWRGVQGAAVAACMVEGARSVCPAFTTACGPS